MGSYTSGYLSVGFSRALSDEELAAYREACQINDEPDPCANDKHEGKLRDPETGRCPHYDDTPNKAGFCHSAWGRYDPNDWQFDDMLGGDVGCVTFEDAGFHVESQGKVYDIVDAVRHFIEALPDDVTVDGEDVFDTDGETWALRAVGRGVEELDADVVIGATRLYELATQIVEMTEEDAGNYGDRAPTAFESIVYEMAMLLSLDVPKLEAFMEGEG